jgi:hypothetical protein
MYDCELIGNSFQTYVIISSGSYAGETKIYANKFERPSCGNLLSVSTSRNVHIANNYFSSYPTNNCYSSPKIFNYSCNNGEIELLVENNIFKRGGDTSFYSSSSNYNGGNEYDSVLSFENGIVTVRNNYIKFLQNDYGSYYQYPQGIYCNYVAVYSFNNNIVSLHNYSNTANLESGGFMGSGTIQTIENNYYQLPTISTNPATLGYITNVSNLGSTEADCRDIDNTVNDIGTYGGPHSWENYHSSSVSKAQILDLEIPYYQVILPGVELQFNSKAIHKN